jgi:hypothetical protein
MGSDAGARSLHSTQLIEKVCIGCCITISEAVLLYRFGWSRSFSVVVRVSRLSDIRVVLLRPQQETRRMTHLKTFGNRNLLYYLSSLSLVVAGVSNTVDELYCTVVDMR